MRRIFICLLATILTVTLGAVTARTVSAHDVHTFGKVTVALGWLHEPAYVGFDNAVQVLVKDSAGNPITAITDQDLKVDVTIGGQSQNGMQLVPTADPDTGLGTPGEYVVHFIPTAPGQYTFHLKGTVAGQAIDETVTSGDKTFNEVTSAESVQFPNKVPAASDLSAKLDQETQRSQAAVQAAQNSANTALIWGVAAAVLAVIACGLAVALSRRRRNA